MNAVEEIEKLQREIEEISQDITQLEQNITSLQNAPPPPPPNEVPIDLDIPETIKHNYLDESIMKYFQPKPTPPRHQQQPKQANPTPINDLELKENILYENIYRMFGITTFPINQYLFSNTSDTILGLRFETYSQFSHTYRLPYYAILRKSTTTSAKSDTATVTTWTHTAILNRYNFTDQENLSRFAEIVYEALNKVQYKTDKFDGLTRFTKDQFGLIGDAAVFEKVSYDSQCQRVNLAFLAKKSRLDLELICSSDVIEIVSFSYGSGVDERLGNQLVMCKAILEIAR
ncbi:Central kinetochore subunit MCM21 [Candida viswanathii]|uniref:Central kinetochore subunit MCM21 n=1 Tax=Candida viswanathii TaxID=5486 RepID=A0A367XV59_9ASCO|nr:Central kinetochore subunit MCM21 [Candida viswanathii]